MIVNKVELAKVAVSKSGYPDSESVECKPEIAFVGKSNVGKSSLINAMIYRKSLARTSQNPGKTRTINFYLVEDLLYFVDLPGYGYAKASKSEVKKWGSMIESYLLKREQLKAIVLLIDIRHAPSENDILMYKWLEHYGYDIIIAATKLDKIKPSQVKKQVELIRMTLNLKPSNIFIPFSSVSKAGRDELWSALENYLSLE